jgi:hypothetical protein
MATDTANDQEQYECFGIPPHVQVNEGSWEAPVPVGWGRRDWLLREAALLGVDATPSPVLAASFLFEVGR